ncbi:hypothetical protein BJ165DRAFT_923708 [Panaeolus papilionaceus]|nr:hypothetical protein BJ165DRAFT_923708 [Panaeolus papilionaceus]
MVITHDSAWYGILDDQSLRRACQVRLAIENHELEATDTDIIQSLYSICVTPGRTAMYSEPKEKRDNADNLGVASQLDLTVAAMRSDGRAVFDYLLGPHGLLQSSSANFDFSHRQLQISNLHGKLLANPGLAAPSTTFDSLQLLDYHPARPVTVEVLLQVLHGEMTAKEACDSNSVGELRKALQAARDDENSTQRILRKLANALLNRALEFTDKDSVEEAIFYYQYLESSTSTTSMEYLELLLGLCTAHYLRYQLLRMREDLDSLIKYLDAQTSFNFVVFLDHFSARCAGMISL